MQLQANTQHNPMVEHIWEENKNDANDKAKCIIHTKVPYQNFAIEERYICIYINTVNVITFANLT